MPAKWRPPGLDFMLKRGINRIFISFLVVSFLLGIAGALQFPTLSLFLTKEVHTGPLWVGLFYALTAIAGVVVSFLLGRYSDRRGDRRKLLLGCCLLAVCNCIVFAYSRNYFVLLSTGMLLSSIASAAMPQLFALAREYADHSASKAAMFNSLMRAQMSLAWVLGPPLAFMLALNYGFTSMFLVAAAVFVACSLMIGFFLPSVARVAPKAVVADAPDVLLRNKDVGRLFVASLLMWTSNSMYMIDMPLYISSQLGLPENLAGLLMGLTAGLEIPFMLLAGWLVQKTGKRRLMLIGVIAGIGFYAGIVAFPFKSALLALQLLNAVFIGTIAGIGLLYFQDLMPGRAGVATTLYTNSITTGVILAGMLQGLVVQYLGHYATYWLATLLLVVALLMMVRVRDA